MNFDEIIPPNQSINACILDCFQHLHASDIECYKREFRTQPHDGPQVMHTFRELIFGSYLCRNGLPVRAYQKIDGKTPDWAMLGSNGEPTAIMDVVNLHANKAADDHIDAMLRQGKSAQLTVDEAEESKRVYQNIKDKCTAYKQIVESRRIPYVIGFFPQFKIAIDRSQIIDNLYLPPLAVSERRAWRLSERQRFGQSFGKQRHR